MAEYTAALNFYNYGIGTGDQQLPSIDDHATDVLTAAVPNVIFARQTTSIRVSMQQDISLLNYLSYVDSQLSNSSKVK